MLKGLNYVGWVPCLSARFRLLGGTVTIGTQLSWIISSWVGKSLLLATCTYICMCSSRNCDLAIRDGYLDPYIQSKKPSQAITCVRKDGNFKEWGTAPLIICALSVTDWSKKEVDRGEVSLNCLYKIGQFNRGT